MWERRCRTMSCSRRCPLEPGRDTSFSRRGLFPSRESASPSSSIWHAASLSFFETACLLYQLPSFLSRTFFKFFFEESSRSKSNFSVLRLSLRDSFNRIPNPRAFVKYFFRFLQKILLQTKNDGSRRRFLFLPMFGQNQTAERQNRAQPHDRRHGFVQNQR